MTSAVFGGLDVWEKINSFIVTSFWRLQGNEMRNPSSLNMHWIYLLAECCWGIVFPVLNFSPIHRLTAFTSTLLLSLCSIYYLAFNNPPPTPTSGTDKIPRCHCWRLVVVIVGACSRSMQPSVSGSDRTGNNPRQGLSKQRGHSISAPASSIRATYADASPYIRKTSRHQWLHI